MQVTGHGTPEELLLVHLIRTKSYQKMVVEIIMSVNHLYHHMQLPMIVPFIANPPVVNYPDVDLLVSRSLSLPRKKHM